MINIAPTPAYVALLYCAAELYGGYRIDRREGLIERLVIKTPRPDQLIAWFQDNYPEEAALVVEGLPDSWPDDDETNPEPLGFRCPSPAVLIPLMRG